MTLGEFTDSFLEAWPLLDVLEMNFEGDLEASLELFTADSAFYPDFARLCRQRVEGWLDEQLGEADAAEGEDGEEG